MGGGEGGQTTYPPRVAIPLPALCNTLTTPPLYLALFLVIISRDKRKRVNRRIKGGRRGEGGGGGKRGEGRGGGKEKEGTKGEIEKGKERGRDEHVGREDTNLCA